MLPWLLLLLVADPQTPARATAYARRPRRSVQPRRATHSSHPRFSLPRMQNKQAVIETRCWRDRHGPAGRRRHRVVCGVHLITRAREGAYDGTVFHRVIPLGIIQGGDPLSEGSFARAAQYGTGGLKTACGSSQTRRSTAAVQCLRCWFLAIATAPGRSSSSVSPISPPSTAITPCLLVLSKALRRQR